MLCARAGFALFPTPRLPRLPSRLTRLLGGGSLAVALLGALPVRLGVTVGHSMEPTLHPGQPFVYQPLDSGTEPLRPGELVLVRMSGKLCIKRVFAADGARYWSFTRSRRDRDRVLIAGGNPVPGWRRRFPRFSYFRSRVPRGQVFVVGDGIQSLDSRQTGPVPLAAVVGRVLYPRPASVSVAYHVWELRELPDIEAIRRNAARGRLLARL